MRINSPEPYDVIELERGETLTVSSTYEMIKRSYDLSALKSVKLKIYDSFFIVQFVDKKNVTKEHAYSDTWDFSIK